MQLVIAGAGGHAREVLDVVEAVNAAGRRPPYEVIGVVAATAPLPGDPLLSYGVPYLGGDEVWATLPASVGVLLGVGSPQVRARLDALLGDRPMPALAHPMTSIGRNVELAPGSVLFPFVSITNHVRVGRHAHVNRNATIGHDVIIGDHALIGPAVAVSGNVAVGERAMLGTGCSLRQGVVIGVDAVVGMGAAVVSDVAAGITVTGVPARRR